MNFSGAICNTVRKIDVQLWRIGYDSASNKVLLYSSTLFVLVALQYMQTYLYLVSTKIDKYI